MEPVPIPTDDASRALCDFVFDSSGFLKHSGVLTVAELERLTEGLADHWQPTSSPGIRRVRNLLEADRVFLDLAHRLASDLDVHRYINQPFRLIESYALERAAGSQQGLHNGFSQIRRHAEGPATRTMWRHHTYHDGRTYCMMVKLVIYLTEIAKPEDGPFCFLDGSHKANFPLPEDHHYETLVPPNADLPNLHSVYASPGDVIVLNEALMHGTAVKIAGPPRGILAYSFAPKFFTDYSESSGDAAADLTDCGFYP